MEKYIITVDGVSYEVTVEKKEEGFAAASKASVQTAAPKAQAAPEVKAMAAPKAQSGAGTPVVTGTAGKVWKVTSNVGAQVKAGDTLLILEAMKMEIPVVAPVDGAVTSILVKEGNEVETGQTVATVE